MRVKENCFYLILVCLALTAAGCASQAQKPVTTEAVTPRLLYQRNCAQCHGTRGEGTQVGTMKTPPLNSGAALADPDEKLFKQVFDGGNGMPPFRYTLDDKQIEDLVHFIREELQARK